MKAAIFMDRDGVLIEDVDLLTNEQYDSMRLFGFPLSGYRCAVDSPERLTEARAAILEGRCNIPVCKKVNGTRV